MKLTIFTPTYNRMSLLQELYSSIDVALRKINTDDCVEWIIIDDGSKNDISQIVAEFNTSDHLSIILKKKENGGKHTAYNMAIDEACSDIFVCIDDDDRLTCNAIKDIFILARKYINKGYGAFVGRVVDDNDILLGANIFVESLESNTIEIRDKYHFWGEPEVFFTSILKKYHFDVFPGEKFLTEAYVFDEMSQCYPFIYTNVVMMVKKYLPNGLTDNQLKIRMQCPNGCEAYYYKRKQLSKGIRWKLKAEVNRQRFGRYSKSIPERRNDIYKIIARPIAWIMSCKDRINCPIDVQNGE